MLNAVMLYHCVQAGLDLAIVNSEKLQRYPFDSRRGTQARRGSDLVARRRSDRGVRRPFPRAQKHRHRRESQVAAARRATGALHPRRFQGRPDRGSERSADDTRPARNHQRPVDEGHGRSRAAVQRQPDDRRRGAAIGRGDEGRGRASRTAHGEVRERRPRARLFSRPSRATFTTSARTWSRSFSATTATASSISASRCRPRN